jgi:3-oxoacyl-[acyl-carrier protein] reductase
VKILGEDANFYEVDISDRAAVQHGLRMSSPSMASGARENAGIVRDAQLVKIKDGELASQMSEADFDRVIAVNLKGVFNCAQAVAPFMVKQGSGVILNATSVVGIDGNFGQTNYVATKSGVIGMTKVWAELGRYGIG